MAQGSTNLVALDRARSLARLRLGEGYAADLIDGDELEQRLDALERAATLSEIDALVADLAAPTHGSAPADAALVPVATASAAEVQPSQRIAAWFSETKRTGPWTPARENLVRSVFATVRLDLREARLAPGTTHFAMDVFMGEVEVIVPPGLPIDIDCSVVFAEVDQDDAVEPGAPTDARIHIGGRVWFGSVKIREMLPGETRSEARKRRKAARKRLSEAKRKALGPAR